MNILLTGASGFIGKNIRESHLAQKYNIIAPTSRELNLLDENSVDDFFRNNKIDIIIHSATTPGHRNSNLQDKVFYNNTRMFFNLERHKDDFSKMLVLGSGAIYDMRNYKPKVKEEDCENNFPIDQHGFSKYVIWQYIKNTDKIIDLRIFGIFGKYEDYAIRFISNMICKAICDLPLTMNQDRKFDYLFVEDLIPVLEYFMLNKAKYKSYNVTPDVSVGLYALAQKVLKITGKDLPIVVAKEGQGFEYSGDNSRLRAEMKNLSFTDIDEAIKKLYEYYLNMEINKELLLVDK